MIRFERTTRIAAPLEQVFAFFSTHENLGRITPPAMRFRILESPGAKLYEGARIRYAMRIAGLPVRWTTRITLWRENEAFADLQERGPYRYWLHTHTFRAAGENEVEMHDLVEYDLPLGILGRLVAGRFVRRQLQAIFDYRAMAIRNFFASGG